MAKYEFEPEEVTTAIYSVCVFINVCNTVVIFLKSLPLLGRSRASGSWAGASFALATIWLILSLGEAASTIRQDQTPSRESARFHLDAVTISLSFIVYATILMTQLELFRSRKAYTGKEPSRKAPLVVVGIAFVCAAARLVLLEVGVATRRGTLLTTCLLIDLIISIIPSLEAIILLFYCIKTRGGIR